jgi:Cys-rich radical ribosomally synthesized peptide
VIQYEKTAYDAMFGVITESVMEMVATCMSQCTGCMCSCRCSCSGRFISDVDWEVL